MHVDVKTAWIGAGAVVLAAAIGVLSFDVTSLFEADRARELRVPDIAEPRVPVAIPVVGTAIEVQAFREDFDGVRPGWPLDREHWVEDGALHIAVDDLAGAVHPFFNDRYQIGAGAFAFSAEARFVAGPDWTYGLVLKVPGERDMLYLALRPDDRFRLTRYRDGRWDDLTSWASLPAGFRPGHALTLSNVALDLEPAGGRLATALQFAGEPQGRLHAYAGGVEIAAVDALPGDRGLRFGVFTTFDIHAVFDDIEVVDLSYAAGAVPAEQCVERPGRPCP